MTNSGNRSKLFNIRSEFLKNFIKLVSGAGIAQALPILLYPVFTRLYTPNDFGTFALFFSIVNILAVIANGKYEQAIMLPKNDSDAFALAKLSIGLSFSINLIFILVIFFFKNSIVSLLKNDDFGFWLYFVPLSAFIINFSQTLIFILNRKKHFNKIAANSIIESSVNSSVKIGFGLSSFNFFGLISGKIMGQFFASSLIFLRIFPKIKNELKKVTLSNVVANAKKYSAFPKYKMIHVVSNTLSGSIVILLLTKYFSSDIAGQYSLCKGIALTPILLFTGSLSKVLYQKVIELKNSNNDAFSTIIKVERNMVLFTIVPFVLAYLFANEIFITLFGENWSIAANYFKVLLPWFFLVMLASPLSFIPDVVNKQRTAMVLDIIYLVARIIAIAIGLIKKDDFLVVVLLSIVSVLSSSGKLIWYLSLSKRLKHFN